MNKIILILIGLIIGIFSLTGCTELGFSEPAEEININETQLKIECHTFKDENFKPDATTWSAIPLCAVVESNPKMFDETFKEYKLCLEFDETLVGYC